MAVKRIKDHSDAELAAAVRDAVAHCNGHALDFYRILHGIDAYMERRKRIERSISAAKTARKLELASDVWGSW